jgi:hypothetical protein
MPLEEGKRNEGRCCYLLKAAALRMEMLKAVRSDKVNVDKFGVALKQELDRQIEKGNSNSEPWKPGKKAAVTKHKKKVWHCQLRNERVHS